MMLLLRIWKSFVSSQKMLTVFIVTSIAASLFCVNVMLGYIQSLYYAKYESSIYSTLTIANLDNALFNSDLKAYLEDEYSLRVGSVLYLSKSGDGAYLIGWDGTEEAGIWFPEMSGRFFTESEIDSSERIVYITEDEFKENGNREMLLMDGCEYLVIGYGWITSYNFSSVIGSESPQNLFEKSAGGSGHEKDRFRIIPYPAFKRAGYIPELLLIHVNGMTYRGMRQLADELGRRFPDASVTIPDKNSDQMRKRDILEYIPYALILSLIIAISVTKVIFEWLDGIKKQVKVYVLCGISRAKMTLALLGSLLLLFAAGEILALCVQFMILRPLAWVGAGYMPRVLDAAAAFAVLLLFVVSVTGKRITKVSAVGREGVE